MAKNKKILLIVGAVVLFAVIAMICLFTFKEEKAIYIVTFDSNGGNVIPEQSVEDGMSASKPQDPTREGYIFIEWVLNGLKIKKIIQ